MKMNMESEFFMHEEISKIHHDYGITIEQICEITQLKADRIVSDLLNEEEHQRLFSFVSGCMILEWKIKGDDVLSGLIQHLIYHYKLSKETIAKAAFISVEELEACQKMAPEAQTDTYQVLAYLYRLHNIVSQADPDFGRNIRQ